MRRLSLITLIALLLCSAVFGAQNAAQTVPANAVKLKGKVLDQTAGAMSNADVQVTTGTPPRVVASGKTDSQGDFELNVAPGQYQLLIKVADFKDINQAVQVTADMPPLNLTMALNIDVGVVTDVTSVTNDVGIDPDSSLNTDVITGDALLDLPDNEDDLLVYLTQLAQLRGGDGEVTLAIDGFTNGTIPPLAQIAEIRIVNSSFSADGSTGPRIEIVTRAGSGKWTASTMTSFADESLNALNHLSTGKRPKSQTRNISVNSNGPVIPGRLSLNLNAANNESDSAANDLRAVTPSGLLSSGITSINTAKSFTISPRLMINKVHNLTSSFTYRTTSVKNSGVGGLTLPERASNNKNNNWQLQISDRITKGKVVDTFRFSQQHTSLNNAPVGIAANSAVAFVLNPATGLPYTVNVTGSFQGGVAPNNTRSTTDNFLLGNTMQWQPKERLTFSAIAFELNYHRSDSNNRNNYNGTFTFASLYDYCATLTAAFSGSECQAALLKKQTTRDAELARIASLPQQEQAAATLASQSILDITPKSPTQFTQNSGDAQIKVSQAELAMWVQGDWRWTPRAVVSFGLRYQVQQHFSDYNNFAPVLGLSYQLRSQGNWKTVVRAGVKKTDSVFSMNQYQQFQQSSATSALKTLTILSPTYPDPFLGGTLSTPTTSNASTRVQSPDAASPYQVSLPFSWEQSMPRGMTASVNYTITRGYRQNRTVNINAPYPGTDLPLTLRTDLNSFDPVIKAAARATVDAMRPFYSQGIVGNINETQSVGKSLNHNLSFQYRVQNYQFLGNRIRLSGNLTYTIIRGKDDNQFENPYDRLADYARTGGTGSRINAQINLSLPRRTTIALSSIGWNSGRNYSWTTGSDTNGDGSNTDRPDGEVRNGHVGPSSLSLPQARITKIFILTTPKTTSTPSLGRLVSSFAEPAQGGGGGGFGGGGGAGAGAGGGGGGVFGAGAAGGNRGAQNPNRVPTGARTISFNIQATNVFNSSVRTNISGVLSSPLFGTVTGGSPGRKITIGMTMRLF